MENRYLDEAALGELIRRTASGTDAQAGEDLEILGDAIQSFHAYVDTVVRGETTLLLRGNRLQGAEYREMVSGYDGNRHGCHEAAIISVRVVNRLASAYGLPPVFTGDDTQRRQAAEFCLELDQYLFRNRRMKLS